MSKVSEELVRLHGKVTDFIEGRKRWTKLDIIEFQRELKVLSVRVMLDELGVSNTAFDVVAAIEAGATNIRLFPSQRMIRVHDDGGAA